MRVALLGLLLSFTNTQAAEVEEVRPQFVGMSGVQLATGVLSYIFLAPSDKTMAAIESALLESFDVSAISKRKSQADLSQFNLFGEISTEYLYFRKAGEKYRKKCNARIYLISGHSGYTEAHVQCNLDVYELGLTHGRGGIHNLFSQWWDWYPENGLYLAEDVLELSFKKLKLSEHEVVRLNEKDFYSREEVLQIVRDIDAQRKGSN
jgi:hypothetical protein